MDGAKKLIRGRLGCVGNQLPHMGNHAETVRVIGKHSGQFGAERWVICNPAVFAALPLQCFRGQLW